MLASLDLTVVPAFVAVVFEPLPERIDPFYAVLTTAGLGSLLGSAVGALRGISSTERAVYAESFSLAFALVGFVAFVVASLIQAVP